MTPPPVVPATAAVTAVPVAARPRAMRAAARMRRADIERVPSRSGW